MRPLYARAASDNSGSLTVLQRAGFRIVGTENSYANARDAEIEETVLRLDQAPAAAEPKGLAHRSGREKIAAIGTELEDQK